MKRVHEFIQNHDCENGAACLAMICDYFGNRISVDDACALCDVTVNGCSAAAICYGAGEKGLNAVLQDLSIDRINEAEHPCIAVCMDEKYVVLEGVREGKVFLCDAIEGHKKVSVDDFQEKYTGKAITFTKAEEVKQAGNKLRQNPIFRMMRLITENLTGRIVVYSGIMLLSTVLCIIKPEIINDITNALFVNDINTQYTALIFYVVVCFLDIIVQYVPILFNRIIREKITIKNSMGFVLSALKLSSNFYDRNGAGDIVLRKTENFDLTRQLTTDLLSFIIEALTVVLCTFYIFSKSAFISIWILLLYIIAYAFLYTKSRARDAAYKKMCYYLTQTSRFFFTSMSMLETIKSAGTEYIFFRKHVDRLAYATESESVYFEKNSYEKILPNILISLVQVVILIGGIYEITQGNNLTLGGVLACFSAYNLMKIPFQDIINTSAEIHITSNSADRVMAIRNNEKSIYEDADSKMLKTEGTLEGEIEVQNLSFAYSRFAEPVLRNISFTVHKGEHVAIVGRSGCGKTTMKNLLTGRYQPGEGRILFDGIPTEQISREVKADSIGAVDQTPMVFDDSIVNNIRMWDDTIEDYEAILAVNDAEIYNVIMERENGLESRILAHGSNFSGGECQRIEIARALAREPQILILDEATSALDAKTEKQVVDNINARGITTITIAHRLSTIRNCDRIFVIDDGELIAEGKHDELMDSCELYNKLVITE